MRRHLLVWFLSKPGHHPSPHPQGVCMHSLSSMDLYSICSQIKQGVLSWACFSTLTVFLISLSLSCRSCLEFLLDNGADPSLRDKQGYTAVHYAAAYGNRQNLELVSKAKPCVLQEMGEAPTRSPGDLQCPVVCTVSTAVPTFV